MATEQPNAFSMLLRIDTLIAAWLCGSAHMRARLLATLRKSLLKPEMGNTSAGALALQPARPNSATNA